MQAVSNEATYPVPPPWELEGSGYVFLLKLPGRLHEDPAFIPAALRDRYCGGLGALMLVDYRRSNAGPYRELLLVPGRFRYGRTKRYTITSIYVSTMASVTNGRANWGIPKELAEFTVTGDGREKHVVIRSGGAAVAQLTVRSGRLRMPVTTALVPAGMRTLAQRREGRHFETVISARGRVATAALTGFTAGEGFPDVGRCRVVAGVHAVRFTMAFPRPRVAGL